MTTWLGLYETTYRQQVEQINKSGGYFHDMKPKKKSLLKRICEFFKKFR